jgi:hypothetical protein
MEKSINVRRLYHRTSNTYHLFESFLYGEYYSKISETDDENNLFIEGLENCETYINKDFIVNVFNEIWNFSELINENPRISEDFITEILISSSEDDDLFKMTKEFDVFDFDFKILDEIKTFCFNILNRNDGKMKMKDFFKKYNNFLKLEMISHFRVKLLITQEEFCLN